MSAGIEEDKDDVKELYKVADYVGSMSAVQLRGYLHGLVRGQGHDYAKDDLKRDRGLNNYLRAQGRTDPLADAELEYCLRWGKNAVQDLGAYDPGVADAILAQRLLTRWNDGSGGIGG